MLGENQTRKEDDFVVSMREERLEERKKKPAILIGVLIGVFLALAIGWFTFGRYVSVYYGVDGAQLPVIYADSAVEGKKPETPGGLNVPDRDKLVYERLRKNNAELPVERLLPVTETPKHPVDISPLEPLLEAHPEDSIGALAEKIMQEESSETLASAVIYADDGAEVEVMFESVPEPELKEEPELEAKEEPKSEVKEVAKIEVKQEAKQEEKVEEKTPESKAPQAVASLENQEKNVYRVQLVSTRSEAAAQSEFKRLAKKYPSILSNQAYLVSKAVSSKGTFYRLRVGSFEEKEQAQSLCQQLKEQKQECFVVQ